MGNLKVLMVSIAAIWLVGCQTSTYMTSAASDGDGITCSEVYQAFNAFSQDRQSATAWAQLSQVISPAASEYANMGVQKAAEYYPQVKAATNLTLAVRGCQPIQ